MHAMLNLCGECHGCMPPRSLRLLDNPPVLSLFGSPLFFLRCFHLKGGGVAVTLQCLSMKVTIDAEPTLTKEGWLQSLREFNRSSS